MAQNPYLMNQIAQGFNFNPGGAFMQGQQDRMSMIAAQYQQQLAQMQVAQAQAAQADAEARKAAQTKFARDRLGDKSYGPLVDSNAVMRSFFPGAEAGDPAAVREYQYWASLPPAGQENYLRVKRANQIATIGGVPTVVSPTGAPAPLSDLPTEANAAATIRGAESQASAQAQADVQAEVDAPKKRAAALQTITNIDNTLANVEEALGAANWATTGFVGESLARIPGTSARDFAGVISTLEAALGFNTLQQMRDASPTGGALGQVSERELNLLTAAIESLDQGQSTGQIVRNLQAVQQHYQAWRNAVLEDLRLSGGGEPQAQGTQPQNQRMRYNPETGQLEPQ